MNILSTLRPKKGSIQNSKRWGRGIGSGKGGTSTKGHKGQKARSGGTIIRGFEGGQMPLARRLPKFGFTNAKFKTTYEVVNLEQLEKFSGQVTPQSLKEAGLVGNSLVKILGRGEAPKGLSVKAHKFSNSAKTAIKEAGGKVEVITSGNE